jgi:hypothetical protein
MLAHKRENKKKCSLQPSTFTLKNKTEHEVRLVSPPAASVPPPQIPILIDVSSDDEDALVAACEESEAKVKALVEAEKERAEAEAKKKAAAAEESAQLENLTCPVCQGIFYEPICITECMHSFCGSCLSAWHFDEKKTVSWNPLIYPQTMETKEKKISLRMSIDKIHCVN